MGIIDRIASTSRLGHNIDDALNDVRAGRMTIVLDGHGHGHLFIPAGAATADAINFMATEARGLICLALTQDRADALGLALQPCRSDAARRPRFTISIEARTGVTTGISAHDRARTIAVAADASSSTADLVSPGHIFPMIAAEDTLLDDLGHCEAGIELAHLADLPPAGVMCAILDDAGAMATPRYLTEFAERHSLSVASAQALAARKLRRRAVRALLHSLDYCGRRPTPTTTATWSPDKPARVIARLWAP